MILLLQYTLIFASVLILVALGGCFAEHSGVINLGLEGIMIMGALGGALTMRYVPNTVPAIVMILAVILVSALVGMVYSCLLAVASINFKADQTLVGTALNLLGTPVRRSLSRPSTPLPTPTTFRPSCSTAAQRMRFWRLSARLNSTGSCSWRSSRSSLPM